MFHFLIICKKKRINLRDIFIFGIFFNTSNDNADGISFGSFSCVMIQKKH